MTGSKVFGTLAARLGLALGEEEEEGALEGPGEESPVGPEEWERAAGAPEACLAAAAVGVCALQELVEYYQCHSLKESFKQLDTTLKYPYKARERAASRTSSRSPGSARPRHTSAPAVSVLPGPHGPGPAAHLPSGKAFHGPH